MDKLPPTKEQLYQWYIVENLTAVQIAALTGYNKSRIFYFLDSYQIPRNKRTIKEIKPAIEMNIPNRSYNLSGKNKIPGKDWLYQRYWIDNLNVTDIARELDVNPNSVTKALHKYQIPIKPRFKAYEGRNTLGRGDWSKSLKTRILHRDNNSCILCKSTRKLEVHHIIPLRLGGKTIINNGVTLCASCHDKVGNQEMNYVEQFLQHIAQRKE